MNKNEIKQIILEEIQAVINEQTEDERIAQAMETGDEDELEALAMGALDRAEQLAADSRPEDGEITPPGIEDMSPDSMLGDDPSYVEEDSLEEMARTSNVFKLKDGVGLKDVLQFMQRVNNVLKTFKSPGQKRPKKRFTPEEMKALATAMVNPDGFTSKDIIANTSYNSPAQANKFLKALEMKGLITLISQLKKSMEPTRDPDAPETRGRKRRDAEFDMSDDPMANLDALGLGGDIDLSDPLSENKTTMSELEKYIKKVIKESKQVRLQEANAAEKQLKDLIAKGVSIGAAQNDEELEEAWGDGANAQGTYKSINLELPGKIFELLQTGVSKLLNIPPDIATNVILAAVPAAVIISLAKGAAIGKDYILVPDIIEKFILKFANKFRTAGEQMEFGKPGVTADQRKKDDEYFAANPYKLSDKVPPSPTRSAQTRYRDLVARGLAEAKNPLAAKMKEIENQGRVAALETKLAAVAEMIEETNGRLTRIDEDNEFRDMMDKNAVKEVRKQLKELERAQAKLQKEYDRAAGGKKRPKPVVDEDFPVDEDMGGYEPQDGGTDPDGYSSAAVGENSLNEISNQTLISAIRKAIERGELKRAAQFSNDIFKSFIGKNAGPNLGILKSVQVKPVQDLGDLAGENIRGLFNSVTFKFENPDVPGQSGRTQLTLSDMDQSDGKFTASHSGAAFPIDDLELERKEVRFVQKLISYIDPSNNTWVKGTAGYNVKGLRESKTVLRMQKLAGLITENDIQKKLNEGIKSAAKEFVNFHVDGNDNEGVQQVTFDEKEYLESGDYRKGTVKHFKDLQNYLNKNKKYEYTSPGGVKYIFTLSGKNIKLKG